MTSIFLSLRLTCVRRFKKFLSSSSLRRRCVVAREMTSSDIRTWENRAHVTRRRSPLHRGRCARARPAAPFERGPLFPARNRPAQGPGQPRTRPPTRRFPCALTHALAHTRTRRATPSPTPASPHSPSAVSLSVDLCSWAVGKFLLHGRRHTGASQPSARRPGRAGTAAAMTRRP